MNTEGVGEYRLYRLCDTKNPRSCGRSLSARAEHARFCCPINRLRVTMRDSSMSFNFVPPETVSSFQGTISINDSGSPLETFNCFLKNY
jgi:hypothetical protein